MPLQHRAEKIMTKFSRHMQSRFLHLSDEELRGKNYLTRLFQVLDSLAGEKEDDTIETAAAEVRPGETRRRKSVDQLEKVTKCANCGQKGRRHEERPNPLRPQTDSQHGPAPTSYLVVPLR